MYGGVVNKNCSTKYLNIVCERCQEDCQAIYRGKHFSIVVTLATVDKGIMKQSVAVTKKRH